MLVLNERNSNEPFTIFAKAEPGRYSNIRLFDQKLGKSDGSELREFTRHRRPGKHCRRRRRDRPTGTCKAVDQNIAPALVNRANLIDAVLRSVQCRRCCDLDRRERAVVEV